MDTFGGARPKKKQTKSNHQDEEIPLDARQTTNISRRKPRQCMRQNGAITSNHDRITDANSDVNAAVDAPNRMTGSTSMTPDFAQNGSTAHDFRQNGSASIPNVEPANFLPNSSVSVSNFTRNGCTSATNFTRTGSASMTVSDISQTRPAAVTVPDLKIMNRELLVIIQAPLQQCRSLCDCGKICGDKSNSNNSDFFALGEQTTGKFVENGKKLRKHNKRSSEEKLTNMSVKEKWRQSGLALKNYVSEKLGFKNKKVKKSEPLSPAAAVKDVEATDNSIPGYVPQDIDFVPEKLTRSRSLLKYLSHKKDKVSKNLMNGKLKKSSSLEMSSSDRPISSSEISSATSDWSSESASTNQCSPHVPLANEIMCNICTCSPAPRSAHKHNDLQFFCKKHKCRKQCKKNKTTKPSNHVTHNCTKFKPDKTGVKEILNNRDQRESSIVLHSDSSDCDSDGHHNNDTAGQRSVKMTRNRRSRNSSTLPPRETGGTNDRYLSESTLNVLSGLQYAIPYLPERFRNRLHVTTDTGTTETGHTQPSCDTSKHVSAADSVPGRCIDGRGIVGRGIDGRGIDGRGIDGQGIVGRGIDGRGIDGRGIDGQGIDGRGIDGRGIDGRRTDVMEMARKMADSRGRGGAGTFSMGDNTTDYTQPVSVIPGNQHGDDIDGYTHNTKPVEHSMHTPNNSNDIMDDLVYLSGFESSIEDPFNVRSHTDSSNELCSGILDIVRTADYSSVGDINYVDSEATNNGMENVSNAELSNVVSTDSDILDYNIYPMSSSDENNYFSKSLLPDGSSDELQQSDMTHLNSFHDLGNQSAFDTGSNQSTFDTGSNQSTLTGFYDRCRMVETNVDQSVLQVSDTEYPGYKALNDSFDRMLQDNESSTSDSPFREHLQRSRSNESGLRSRSSDGLRSRSSDENVEADDEFECDCGHCQFLLTQHNISGDNVAMTTGENVTPTTGENVTTATNDYQQDVFDDFHVPFDLALYTDTAITEHDAEQYRSTNSWDIGFPFIPNIPLLLSGSPLGELLEDVIEHMLAARPELFLDEQYPPARKDVIDSLPTVSLTLTHLEQNPSCPICLCVSELDETMTVLPCQHIFHPLCIQAWLTKSGTCPVCRRKIRNT